MTLSERAKEASLWAWVASGVLLISAGGGITLFAVYGHYFPELSGVRDDWNVFGAVLGGFGSCVGAGATLATLLFLAHQNRKQQEFIELQTKAQNFEQFLTHQRVFGERIEQVRARYDHKIKFPEVETLYLGLFPNNGPANVDLVVKPEHSESDENLLGKLKAQFERLDSLLMKTEWSEAEAYGLATNLSDLVSDLGFEWVGEQTDGDIVKGHFHTGINIYSLHEALRRMKQVYDVYLRFSGNPEFDGLNQGVTRFVSEALMRCRRLRRHVVYNKIPGLSTLQDLLFEVDALRDDSSNWLLPETYRMLQATFESREDVARLNDVNHYVYILGHATQEIRFTLPKLGEHDPRHARLEACRESFYAIFGDIRQT
ncbi:MULTISPECIES: hypothetical protein [unclassified Pseudomonas]|uniref:hypothetical protein n=1 Tax=unclassified Pseudomonas TaxID=196821 RepID=UPI002AC8E431|nr:MULTISPECIES: hypothetical protein [unclassified Pseudomonas]MEB0044119.1 hypothetical protein [Pseudomonas sp. Dout3]MEB0094944.1 hypothetical protein [Pseudomonas sp. DC1.2]WPX59697.1 hypothetical protein RHM68_03340 [Pseudomonas sp. DC1.2]